MRPDEEKRILGSLDDRSILPFDVIGLTLNEVRHLVLNVIEDERPLRLEAAILEARGKSWP